jgi:hypothetical protein
MQIACHAVITIVVLGSLVSCKVPGKHAASSHLRDETSDETSVVASELVVPKSIFPSDVREKVIENYRQQQDLLSKESGGDCPKTSNLLQRIFNRLIDGASLQKATRQSPALTLRVVCSDNAVKLPETKFGIVWFYPQVIRGLKTEDHVASLLAREIIRYTRSHDESNEQTRSLTLPFRDEAVNRARWEQEKEADRLSVKILSDSGYDPFAGVEEPRLLDKFLAQETDWKEEQIIFPIGTMLDRSIRAKLAIEYKKLLKIQQTPGDLLLVIGELERRG